MFDFYFNQLNSIDFNWIELDWMCVYVCLCLCADADRIKKLHIYCLSLFVVLY